METKNKLNLKGFHFQELLTPSGLKELDNQFLKFLAKSDPKKHSLLLQYRSQSQEISATELSQFLIECAVIIEDFIAALFDIEDETALLRSQTLSHRPLFAFKAYYVLKQAKKNLGRGLNLNFYELNQWISNELLSKNLILEDRQLAIAKLGILFLADPKKQGDEISKIVDWCIAAMTHAEGREMIKTWEIFHIPKHLDFQNLVAVEVAAGDPHRRLQGPHLRHRDGFELTDSRMTQRQVMAEIDYCVYCHKNQGDFCSRGFPVKKNDPKQELKVNNAGETLTGCPLEEKISEMHVLKKEGFGIAALAMIMADNPMCPITGHRICNDCMKACIYQKQEPVNIPQTETRILTDVLSLPWGVEIYDLLARWNPLRSEQWLLKPYNGLKVLVMGLGPAGFSLAHHLLMEGFAVAGMDGLKIEPLPEYYLTQPIYQYDAITEKLSDRMVSGFGGVAEYGITVRWDKNFLKLVYLSLSRRHYFQAFGNVRFGGTLKVEDAWTLGFDHLALAVGAGLPKELSIPNSLAPGMRQANDFLMALQLTGAAKTTSLANLQIRLPAVVIGGGLTAVDTATEVQAYYLVQIEKIAARYQQLLAKVGEKAVRSCFLPADLSILDEFMTHALELAEERKLAETENRKPDLIKLIRKWGGVTIAYRRTMQESPAYRLNHEELIKAFEEGIYYTEGLEPEAVILDGDGQVQALRCAEIPVLHSDDEPKQVLPARSILVATGARLNVAYEFEHRGTFLRQDRFEYQAYQQVNGDLQPADIQTHAPVKNHDFGAFTSYTNDGRLVTFLGDTHPLFHGSVVKAIASAKKVYPKITQALADKMNLGDEQEYRHFNEKIQRFFTAKVVSVLRHNHLVVELQVHAPMAAKNGGDAQFYRLQNFEVQASIKNGVLVQMEGVAVLGVKHPEDSNILSFFIVERGASSKWVRDLKPSQPIALMGPTGARSPRLPKPSVILVVGDILSPAFLLSMAQKFRQENHRIWYVGQFTNLEDIYCRDRIEELCEKTQWLTSSENMVAALQQFDLSKVDQVWVIGSHCLLQQVRSARTQELRDLAAEIPVLGSVYGPMQCMMKGVCAQCLQWQIDPLTGKRTKAVYACSWQHQPLERIDIHHISERVSQNRCHETLNDLWADHFLFSKA